MALPWADRPESAYQSWLARLNTETDPWKRQQYANAANEWQAARGLPVQTYENITPTPAPTTGYAAQTGATAPRDVQAIAQRAGVAGPLDIDRAGNWYSPGSNWAVSPNRMSATPTGPRDAQWQQWWNRELAAAQGPNPNAAQMGVGWAQQNPMPAYQRSAPYTAPGGLLGQAPNPGAGGYIDPRTWAQLAKETGYQGSPGYQGSLSAPDQLAGQQNTGYQGSLSPPYGQLVGTTLGNAPGYQGQMSRGYGYNPFSQSLAQFTNTQATQQLPYSAQTYGYNNQQSQWWNPWSGMFGSTSMPFGNAGNPFLNQWLM